MNMINTLSGQPTILDDVSQSYQALAEEWLALRSFPSLRPYNLTISHERKLVWFRVAKVCTRSIYHHLSSLLSLASAHPYNVYYPPRLYEDYFKFAFVRNPWDRLISCWHNKVLRKNAFSFDDETNEKMKDLGAFVDYVATLDLTTCNAHLRLQSCLIDLNQIDYLGRFERFREDYESICQQIGISSDQIEHRNQSVRRDYHYYYDDHIADRVSQLYRKDIQLFGYRYA